MPSIDTDPSPESIDRELARAEARKRRTRWLLAGSAALAVVGVVALQLARAHHQRRVLETAWSHAAGCLLGGPLPKGASPSLHVHRTKLALAGQKTDWPARCAEPLESLNQELVKQKRGEALASHAHTLATELAAGATKPDHAYLLDQLAAKAAELELSTSAVQAWGDALPAPIVAPNLTTLPADARLVATPLGAHAIASDLWPGTELHLLLHDAATDAPPCVCTFNRAGPDAVCRTITGAAARAEGLRLGGTTAPGAPPLLFGRLDSEEVVFRSDSGDEVARGNLGSAFIGPDGAVAVIVLGDHGEGSFELVEEARPGAPRTRRLVAPKDFEATKLTLGVVAHGVALVQTLNDEDESETPEPPALHAATLPLPTSGPAFTKVGALDAVNASLSLCRTTQALVLQVGRSHGYLAFFADGSWSVSERHEQLGNQVACRGEAVLLHDVGPVRACDRRGCRDAGLEDVDFGDVGVVRPRRAVLGDKLLGVAESEHRQGVRWVHGAGTPEVLFDDRVRKDEVQVNSTVSGTRIFSRDGFAVVTLFTDEGVVAFYFGADAKPEPARITTR